MSTDVLIRKADKTVIRHWPGLAERDIGFGKVGPARPANIGDHILVAADEVKPTPGAGERLAGPVFTVADDFAVTATWSVVPVPFTPSPGASFAASIRRRAAALEAAGKTTEALLLLRKKGL